MGIYQSLCVAATTLPFLYLYINISFLMYHGRASIRLGSLTGIRLGAKRTYATTSYSTPAPHPSRITDADVHAARTYCATLLQKFDSPSYTLQTFVPPSARDAYLSIRALNIELARIPELVSNPTVGALRMQFWRDNLTRTFAHTPPKEPVAILLHHALQLLQDRHPGISTSVMKGWSMKVINAREQYMDNRPYTSMEGLETYAENTYSTLMYLTLAALPLDFMAQAGVKEEEIFRQGAEAPGLKDAIFTVATRANDHLITAREMLKNLQQGKDAGHDFEHEGEEGHQYYETSSKGMSQADEIERGFGGLMPALATRLWLEKLEKYDFDVFRPELRSRGWRLPWKGYW